MILAIVGSTKFTHPDALDVAREILLHKLEIFQPEVVISGGAEGIDKLGAWIAAGMGFATVEYLPENPRWEPDGFKARNLLIAQRCTHLLAIRDHRLGKNNGWMPNLGRSTFGSGFTAVEAQKNGAVVETIVL